MGPAGLCEDFGIHSEFVGEAGGAFEQRHGNKSISCRLFVNQMFVQ